MTAKATLSPSKRSAGSDVSARHATIATDRERMRQYRAANLDHCRGVARRYNAEHVEARRAHYHRWRAERDDVPGRGMSADDVRRVLDQRTCTWCNAPADTLDHVVPLSKGGRHEPENVVLACEHCNKSKLNRDVDRWLVKKFTTEEAKAALVRLAERLSQVNRLAAKGVNMADSDSTFGDVVSQAMQAATAIQKQTAQAEAQKAKDDAIVAAETKQAIEIAHGGAV